jgi:hypothetical protein
MAQPQAIIDVDLIIIHKTDGWHYVPIDENKETGSTLLKCSKCEDLVVVTHIGADETYVTEPLSEPAQEPPQAELPVEWAENLVLPSGQTKSPTESLPQGQPSDSPSAEKSKRRRKG